MPLEVSEMGARGDAFAAGPQGPIYVPFSLPGERVEGAVLADRADIRQVLTASAERITPMCPHFGRCGGCQLQHWAEGPYLAWKQGQLEKALAKRGIVAPMVPIQPAWGRGRRRATFHASRAGRAFGFVERGGARINPISACPVLVPELVAALPALKTLLLAFAPARGEATGAALWTDEGLDLDIKGAGRPDAWGRARLEQLGPMAEAADLARLSFDGVLALQRRPPSVRMGRARVEPPPGAFLQPTAAGEEALAAAALAAVAGADRVADLFAGIGTFALRLAEHAEVFAVEGDGAMIAALKSAADAMGGLRGVIAEKRDLFRTPVSALELKRYDAVVFDPPRSGAKLQAEQIGRSKVSKVAAVSCDAVSFARDAAVLIEAGFRLTQITPLDQFRFTPHLEIVGAFER
jgi:23S rRNA (uracil1939-C5)-methyltransferase